MTIAVWKIISIAILSCLAGFVMTAVFAGRRISCLENSIINALIDAEFGKDHEKIMDGLRAALNGDDYDE
ncbi:MAG: hypothetical protein E6713_02850 [Sporomusaceae bacterium]|nr:hypothetical protein [Sporomusaceae bacterium]